MSHWEYVWLRKGAWDLVTCNSTLSHSVPPSFCLFRISAGRVLLASGQSQLVVVYGLPTAAQVSMQHSLVEGLQGVLHILKPVGYNETLQA